MKVDKSVFYNPNRLLSYDAPLNFVVGSRGVGKTYGFIKFVIQRFLRYGEEFVYLRRYATELETSVPKFFDFIKENNEFPETTFAVKKSKKLSTFIINGKTAGYAIALSTASVLKSTSFARVKYIIFDEFIIDKGTYHYISGTKEPAKLLDVWETIARLRDIKVFCLGNAVTITNPYWEYFGIKQGYKSEFKVCKRADNGEPLIVLDYIKNEAYEDAKSKTKFGQIVQGTQYGDYAVRNQWYLDDSKFISKRPPNCFCNSIFVIDGKHYGSWCDRDSGDYWVSKDYDPSNPCKFALDNSSHDLDTALSSARQNTWFMFLLRYYNIGHLFFEDQTIKNCFVKLFEQINGC